jgi:hypothetical protein
MEMRLMCSLNTLHNVRCLRLIQNVATNQTVQRVFLFAQTQPSHACRSQLRDIPPIVAPKTHRN